ncbi:MAG: GntR family transcriptional regulator [Anaerolineae bacterium]|nr:GntR family transcriptional regulator [Anaerolineae bacterium]
MMHYTERINRKSKLPLYQQLYEILRGLILARDWKPGDRIPSEPELVARYAVSRTTVRQVLDKLANEGLIVRQRGRGTYVAYPTVEKAMVRIVSFTEDMRERGFEPGTRVLSAELVPAPEEVAAPLQVPAGEELARLERLRLANGVPMSLEEAYLVHRYCAGVLRHDFSAVPLRETLERDCGIRLVRARQAIRAISASARIAGLLQVRPKAALLFIERISYSQHDVPVEFLRIYYRGDRYSLYNELQG